MLKLKGVIPALTTPFKDDQSMDLDAFQELVDIVIKDGVHAIVPNGCTGESWALSDDERMDLFKAAVNAAAGRVPVIAGAGGISVRDAMIKVRQAEKAGADAIMTQAPWYVMPGEEEIFDYYKGILASTDLPMMVYNIPRRTGVTMSADLIDRLADQPGVIALKESSKNWLLLSDIIRRCRDRISILTGYFQVLGLAAFAEGAVGYVDSATPVIGKMSVDYYNAAMSGDMETARRLQVHLANLNKGFFGIGTFPAATKVALELLGRPGGRPRDPIRPLNAQQREQVREALTAAGLLPNVAQRKAS
jgi:4-hydroxy-tetrahydrodipicolinate synthase